MVYWQNFRYKITAVSWIPGTRSILNIFRGIFISLSLNPSKIISFQALENKKSDACEVAVGIQLWPFTNKTLIYTQV